ncbi:hypothetical protein CGC20_27400 [Leishmania donovani]|uniref:Uncharacterized protein n=1 Tax=Leishmania donovani TaxID=5661 RepID=A0A504XWQ0_LEIDO|nr:hypothetical protein CGC20_27400 [Leishmania donovani]
MGGCMLTVCGPDGDGVSLDERTRVSVQIAPGDTLGDLAQTPATTAAGSAGLVGAGCRQWLPFFTQHVVSIEQEARQQPRAQVERYAATRVLAGGPAVDQPELRAPRGGGRVTVAVRIDSARGSAPCRFLGEQLATWTLYTSVGVTVDHGQQTASPGIECHGRPNAWVPLGGLVSTPLFAVAAPLPPAGRKAGPSANLGDM